MNFQDFIKKGSVRKATSDKIMINSLIRTSEEDLKFLRKLKIDKLSARKITSNYYDILRVLIDCLALSKGYKIYSHESLTYFLKFINKPILAEKFERFRKIRNGINYYGRNVSIEESEDIIKEIKLVINILLKDLSIL